MTMSENKANIKVPIELIELQDKGFHVGVKASINNHNNLLLLIDTGASNSVFDINNEAFSDIEKEDLPTDNISSGFNSNIEHITFGRIEKINLNGYETFVEPALFTSLDHVNSLYQSLDLKPLAGIIGCDFLIKNSVIIDLSNCYICIKP